ncbi:hypothetical protein K438DRAFT_531190 [Mycena galopus ATCC 62051]|nr:hypothetical protein K438DRAFT_531190 [Mycena galopus ATCC 62051]
MPFISNADNFTLGDGVYNNIHGDLNIVHNNFYGKKRHRDQICNASAVLTSTEPARKRRRRAKDSADEIKVIRKKHLKLTLQIGCGPGYFLHAGEIKGRAVIAKVFNAGATARQVGG